MRYRENRNYENLEKRIFTGAGDFDIPVIEPVTQYAATDFVGFNYAKSCKEPVGKGVHFFVDDYQFNRLWTNTGQYIPMLSRFACVLSPDFSTYTDFPRAIQIYNHYRKHWVAAFLQEQGITVIPTISWSGRDSFSWCFDGEPCGSTVAVSSVGCMKNKEARSLFLKGYREMVSRLQPDRILFYGNVPDECMGNIVRIKAYQDKWKEVV